jgi:small subunit ribosomal protein S1
MLDAEQPDSPEESTSSPQLRIHQERLEEYTPDQIREMTEMYEPTFGTMQEGGIVRSKVLRVTDTAVILDVGFKSEGAVSVDEFKDAHTLKEGDEVEVFLEHLEDHEGAVVLSKKKADFMRVWERIRQAYESDEPVDGTLVKKIKGGVVVDLMGVDAFLPGSQIALRRVPNVDELLGQTFQFKIIKLNKRRRNIVVSRRVILEAERATKREHLMKELEVGQVRKGIVKNITDFGAFVDLGGVDGLLHITDMSYGRVSHPSEVVQISEEIEVKILDIDWDRERISLGRKQLLPYPWSDVSEKYPVGSRVQGKVVSITNYGAFIELEPGIEGLVHISEMSWTRNVRHPSKIVSIGETIEAVVLKVDEGEEKISLGMKQTEQDPWITLPVKYPVGARLPGKVRNLTSFGAFVELEPGIDGLVHISDMSWTKRVQHPSEVVKKADAVDVVVLSIDAENKRISLGLKQAQPDPWLKIGETYPVGTALGGRVIRFMDKGVVVDLQNDIEGFVPMSQLGVPDVHEPQQAVSLGQRVELMVLEVDPIHHRIVLSVTEIHALTPEDEAAAPAPIVVDDDEAALAEAAETGVGDVEPERTDATVERTEAEPEQAEAASERTEAASEQAEAAPEQAEAASERTEAEPERTEGPAAEPVAAPEGAIDASGGAKTDAETPSG